MQRIQQKLAEKQLDVNAKLSTQTDIYALGRIIEQLLYTDHLLLPSIIIAMCWGFI